MIKSLSVKLKDSYENAQELLNMLQSDEYEGLTLDIADVEQLNSGVIGQLLVESFRSNHGPIVGITSDKYDLFDFAIGDKALRDDALAFFIEIMQAVSCYKEPYQRENTYTKPPITGPMPIVLIKAQRDVVIDDYELAYNNIFFAMDTLAKQAERLGIFFAFENPDHGVFLSPLELREFINSFNCPHAGLWFNPGHASKVGLAIDWLNILDRRVLALHLGEDWPEIITRFSRVPAAGPVIY